MRVSAQAWVSRVLDVAGGLVARRSLQHAAGSGGYVAMHAFLTGLRAPARQRRLTTQRSHALFRYFGNTFVAVVVR